MKKPRGIPVRFSDSTYSVQVSRFHTPGKDDQVSSKVDKTAEFHDSKSGHICHELEGTQELSRRVLLVQSRRHSRDPSYLCFRNLKRKRKKVKIARDNAQ